MENVKKEDEVMDQEVLDNEKVGAIIKQKGHCENLEISCEECPLWDRCKGTESSYFIWDLAREWRADLKAKRYKEKRIEWDNEKKAAYLLKHGEEMKPTLEEWAEQHKLVCAMSPDCHSYAYTDIPTRYKDGWHYEGNIMQITSLIKPVKTNEGWDLSLYIPSSMLPKYKPYDRPKFEWILEDTFFKQGIFVYRIISIGRHKIGYSQIAPTENNQIQSITLKNIFKKCTDMNGLPFGELDNGN